jgi:hypothetical protein
MKFFIAYAVAGSYVLWIWGPVLLRLIFKKGGSMK